MEFPVYKIVLPENDEKFGLKLMSLVDEPAIMVDWVKFKNQKPEEAKFSIQNEEQRIIFGPSLIPDLPIYRSDPKRGEFFLTVDAPTIQDILIKYMKDGLSTAVDVMHSEKPVDGIVIFESFLKTEDRATNAKGFDHLPNGTLFHSAKVYNDQVWEDIKSGKLRGYSIDALFRFDEPESVDAKEIQEITEEILLQILSE
jgi:hypothetical protein